MRATRDRGFGDEVKRRIILGTYALSSGYYDAYYGQAQKVRTLISRDFAAAFEQADVLLSPDGADDGVQAGGEARRPGRDVPVRRRRRWRGARAGRDIARAGDGRPPRRGGGERELRRHVACAPRDHRRDPDARVRRRVLSGRRPVRGEPPTAGRRAGRRPGPGRRPGDDGHDHGRCRRCGPEPGDVATIYGGRVSLDQQAAAAGTIAYELLTALGARVPRRYGRDAMNAHFASLVLGLAHQAESALGGNAAARRRGRRRPAHGGPDPDRHARHAAGKDRGPARARRAPAARSGAHRAPLPFRADRARAREPTRRDHRARRARDRPGRRHRRLWRRGQQHAGQRRPRGRWARAAHTSRRSASAAARRSPGVAPRAAAAAAATASPSPPAPARTAHRVTGSCAGSCSTGPFPTYPHGFPGRGDRRVLAAHRPRRARQQAGLGHRRCSTSSARSTGGPANGSSTPRPTASSRWRRTRQTVPLAELYAACAAARAMLQGEHGGLAGHRPAVHRRRRGLGADRRTGRTSACRRRARRCSIGWPSTTSRGSGSARWTTCSPGGASPASTPRPTARPTA